MVGLSRRGWRQRSAPRRLRQTAEILTLTRSMDAEGNPTETWAVTATVPFSLQERGTETSEPVEGGRVVSRSLWTGYAPYDTALTAENRVRINGAEYQVIEDDGAREGTVVKIHLLRLGEG